MSVTPALLVLNALALCNDLECVPPSFCGCMFWNVTIVVLGEGVVGKVCPKCSLSAAEMDFPWRLDWTRGGDRGLGSWLPQMALVLLLLLLLLYFEISFCFVVGGTAFLFLLLLGGGDKIEAISP